MYMRRPVDTLTTPTMSFSDLELRNGFQTGQLHPGVSDIRQFEKHIGHIDKLVRVETLSARRPSYCTVQRRVSEDGNWTVPRAKTVHLITKHLGSLFPAPYRVTMVTSN